MITLFLKGGPVMWPLLVTSVVAVSVVLERLVFSVKKRRTRDAERVAMLLHQVEHGHLDEAGLLAKGSKDFVVKTLAYGLEHRKDSISNALLFGATKELKQFSQGLAILDTIITLAPLLGLFGTVTGMIHAFGLLGNAGLGAPTAITGGIAEALIATAFGLVIAVISLIPFNFLNTQLEEARHELEVAATYLELMVLKHSENR